jgi:hypothetical protein
MRRALYLLRSRRIWLMVVRVVVGRNPTFRSSRSPDRGMVGSGKRARQIQATSRKACSDRGPEARRAIALGGDTVVQAQQMRMHS